MRKAALHSVNVVCVSPTCSEILRDRPDRPPDNFVHLDVPCRFQAQDSTDLILERIKEDSKQKWIPQRSLLTPPTLPSEKL